MSVGGIGSAGWYGVEPAEDGSPEGRSAPSTEPPVVGGSGGALTRAPASAGESPEAELSARLLRARLDGDAPSSTDAATQTPRRAAFHTDPTLAAILDGNDTLARGARGQAVVEVQRALLDLDYDLGAAGCDGDFGPAVGRALRAFQQDMGLPVTGEVDRATLEALEQAAPRDPRSMATPLIEASVGPNGRNRPSDVKAVQERLSELGFFDGRINGRWSARLGSAIKLFDGIVSDLEMLPRSYTTRRRAETLSPGEAAEAWLRADNAPRWERLPAGGTGWQNDDRDGYSYATSWLRDALERVGRRYAADYLGDHPEAAQIHTNDASLRRGGDTPDHETHETGLDLDVRLGTGGTNVRWAGYDREETWAKIKAFLDDEDVDQVLFADRTLVERANTDPRYAGRLIYASDHDDHFHVDFRVPDRIGP